MFSDNRRVVSDSRFLIRNDWVEFALRLIRGERRLNMKNTYRAISRFCRINRLFTDSNVASVSCSQQIPLSEDLQASIDSAGTAVSFSLAMSRSSCHEHLRDGVSL